MPRTLTVDEIQLWADSEVTQQFFKEIASAKEKCYGHAKSCIREDETHEANYWVGFEDALESVLAGPERLKQQVIEENKRDPEAGREEGVLNEGDA